MGLRRLYIVLGDQLDRSALHDLDPAEDAVWMAEVESETTHVPCHKQRILMFLSAMRHFREDLGAEGVTVHYRELTRKTQKKAPRDHRSALELDLPSLAPSQVVLTQPGDFRVLEGIRDAIQNTQTSLELREDSHFFGRIEDFAEWAEKRKSLVLEHFYRRLRKRENILMDPDGEPEGGAWNFDAENRDTFGTKGPPPIPPLPRHEWDEITSEVAELVEARYPDHPGETRGFSLPVTPHEAHTLADHFIENCLPHFGQHQDAMWDQDAVLWHSRLSAPLNLKLINPRYLVESAVQAYHSGAASIQSVEGFVRQLLGWREFIRGVYWTKMPDYAASNALDCPDRDVPSFYWDGATDMACIAGSIQRLLELGYVHHIHRLMVLGLFAMQLGVHPYRFHEWHMAMYLDAVDWVSLPNALGMSQYGDGGVVGSKPYAATGKYIKRMSNYCKACRYRPEESSGDRSCPFTTLYWAFLDQHQERFRANSRMALQVRNLDRKSPADLEAIRSRARWIKEQIDSGKRL